MAISPTFMLCGATGQSQATSLLCVMLSILGYAWARERAGSSLRGGLLAGGAVALGLCVRIQVLAPAGAVIACAFGLLSWCTRDARGLLGFVGMSSLGVLAIGTYDMLLTGDPLALPWFLQGGRVEHYGFVRVWAKLGFVHTPLGALQNLCVVLVRMNSWLFGWPLVLFLIWRRSALRRVWHAGKIFVAVAAALVVFELGYYSPGASDVGPIYHFEVLPCLCVVTAQCLIELWQRRPELAMVAVVVHTFFGTGSFVVEQTARLARLIELAYEEPRRVADALPAHSLLLYEPANSCLPPLGWVPRPFPLVNHDPNAPLVSYAIASATLAQELAGHFPDRACFFLHHDAQLAAALTPCAAAQARPPSAPDPSSCPRLHSSAEALRRALVTER